MRAWWQKLRPQEESSFFKTLHRYYISLPVTFVFFLSFSVTLPSSVPAHTEGVYDYPLPHMPEKTDVEKNPSEEQNERHTQALAILKYLWGHVNRSPKIISFSHGSSDAYFCLRKWGFIYHILCNLYLFFYSKFIHYFIHYLFINIILFEKKKSTL